jgi:hypothetical protein
MSANTGELEDRIPRKTLNRVDSACRITFPSSNQTSLEGCVELGGIRAGKSTFMYRVMTRFSTGSSLGLSQQRP